MTFCLNQSLPIVFVYLSESYPGEEVVWTVFWAQGVFEPVHRVQAFHRCAEVEGHHRYGQANSGYRVEV
jgi:hypothetical protein